MSLVETWRDRGLCLSIDPREFDDGGTPTAWNACRQCPVAAECLADAKAAPERTQGVYRAGRSWGAKAQPTQTIAAIRRRHAAWVAMWAQGHSPTDIAYLYDCHADTVRRALRLRPRARP